MSFLKFLVSFFVPICTFFIESIIVINIDLLVLLNHFLGNDANNHTEYWMFHNFKSGICLRGKLVVDFVSKGCPEIGQIPVLRGNVENDIFEIVRVE